MNDNNYKSFYRNNRDSMPRHTSDRHGIFTLLLIISIIVLVIKARP